MESTARRPLTIVLWVLLSACVTPTPVCESGSCSDAGLVINELAGSGGDFVELFNASDTAFDLSTYGLTDADDAGIRYATTLRFATGTTVAPRGFFTIFLESDCPTTITPCVRGEFGISQANGDTLTLLDPASATLVQEAYPPNAASSGSSWARASDGAGAFGLNSRTPGATNER